MTHNAFLGYPTFGGGVRGRHRRAGEAASGGSADGAGGGDTGAEGGSGAGEGTSEGGTNQGPGAVTYVPYVGGFAYSAPPPPLDIQSAITVGEIEAWRVWRVKDGALWSMAMTCKWPVGRLVAGEGWYGGLAFWATLKLTDHSGGVHAFKERALAETYALDSHVWDLEAARMYGKLMGDFGFPGAAAPVPASYILGRVALWGEVIEHERGYRAEFGKVAALDEVLFGPAGLLDEMRAKYFGEGDAQLRPRAAG